METYHKIQTLFKRHQDGPDRGKMIRGEWTTPELEYLAGNEWEFTEKVDGTNVRVGYDPYVHPADQVQFAGRTDRAVVPQPLLEHLQNTFKEYPYDVFGTDVPARVILFGEGYGPKIQNGGNYRDDVSFVLFDVKIDDWWLKRDDVNDVADKLGIDSVPVVGYGTLYDGIARVAPTPDHCMRSAWGAFEAEGIVARPVVPLFNRKGERIITKIKAVDFR